MLTSGASIEAEKTNISYGQARTVDAGDLMPLLIDFYREVGVAPLDVEKMVKVVATILERGVVVVARTDDGPVGALGLMEEEIWYSRATRLVNAFFVVSPAHRGRGIGATLLRLAARLAEDRGSLLEIDVVNTARARGRVAEKFGLVPVGYLSRFGGDDVPVGRRRR